MSDRFPIRPAARAATRVRLAGLFVVVVALTVSFYVTIALLLLVVGVVWLFVLLSLGHILLLLLGPILALSVAARRMLRAARPRRDRGTADGIVIERHAAPRLWALVDDVCARTGERRPDELRIMLAANACAAELHASLSHRRRRVLTVSLPFMAALSVDELTAVVAHEIGHFAHGDTTYARWLLLVRDAVGRTQAALAYGGSALRRPYGWYARAFYALTDAYARRRERVADAFAASCCGAPSVARALRVVAVLGEAFDDYWDVAVAPVLDAGFRPPLTQGFEEWLAAPRVVAAIARIRARLESAPEGDHPSIVQRLGALGTDGTDARIDDRRAVDLLGRPDPIEAELLRQVAAPHDDPPQAIAWADVATAVYVPKWERDSDLRRNGFGGLHAPDIATALSVSDPRCGVLAGALALALLRAGWSVSAPPGRGFVMARGDQVIEPFREVQALTLDDALRASWRARCDALGIANLSLDDPQAPAPQAWPAPLTWPAPVGARRDPTPLELAIDETRAYRTRERVGSVLVGVLFALAVACAVIFLVLLPAQEPQATDSARIVGTAILAGVMFYGRRLLRRRGRPAVCVCGDMLTVTYPELLATPLRVPLDTVRLMAVDDGTQARWLFDGGLFPSLNVSAATPNLAVLFDAAVVAPPTRNAAYGQRFADGTFSGFVVRVTDPQRAGTELASRNLSRPVRASDMPARPIAIAA